MDIEYAYCPYCEEKMLVQTYLYGDDADGNRGIWIREFRCPLCDYSEEEVLQDVRLKRTRRG